MAPEARDYDPELALFSGEDGLDLIRGIERTAHRLLRPGGVVVIEHADTQGGQVPWIFTEERAGPTRPTTPTSTTARASRPPAGRRREHPHPFDPQQYVYEEAR